MKTIFNPKFLISLTFSFVALYYSFEDFNFNSFINIIKKIQIIYIIIPCILLIVSVWIRALRWRYLITKNDNIRVKDLFELEMIGFFGNNIFPLRFGEFYRIFLLSQKFSLSKSLSAGSVFIERILDIIGLLALSFFLFFYPINFELKKYIVLSLFIFLVILLLLIIVKDKIIQNNYSFFNDFFESFNILRSDHFKKIIFFTLMIWMIFWINVHLIQFSLNIGLSIFDSLLILLLSTLAIAIPAAPGMIGTFHFAVIFSMEFLGFETDLGSTYAILLHAYGFITFTLIGLFYFLKYQTYYFSLKKNEK